MSYQDRYSTLQIRAPYPFLKSTKPITKLKFSPAILVSESLKRALKESMFDFRKINLKRDEAKLVVCGYLNGQDE